MRILLTDGLQRKTLAALRALGKEGNEVLISEYTRMNPAAFSKYGRGFLTSPNPHKEPQRFLAWLLKTLQDYDIQLLIPMDDRTMAIVVHEQDQIKKLTQVLLPAEIDYRLATDKGESLKIALASGAICPQTLWISELGELEHLKDRVIFPSILKPRNESGSRGIRKVENWNELMEAYLAVKEPGCLPILQAYIEQGLRYDVCLLYDDEYREVASFVQKELRHFPEPMGPSTVQESVKNDMLLETARMIMKQFHWKGIAELEFMESPLDGKFYFMEINTRFWASLQCAISSGVNFPVLYKEAAFGQAEAVTDYQTGVRCRWLFPGDILRWVSVGHKGKWDPPFHHGIKKGIIDDIYTCEDPWPLLGVGLAMIRFVLDVNMWKLFFWR